MLPEDQGDAVKRDAGKVIAMLLQKGIGREKPKQVRESFHDAKNRICICLQFAYIREIGQHGVQNIVGVVHHINEEQFLGKKRFKEDYRSPMLFTLGQCEIHLTGMYKQKTINIQYMENILIIK